MVQKLSSPHLIALSKGMVLACQFIKPDKYDPKSNLDPTLVQDLAGVMLMFSPI
jgi:hypothetical protein